MTSARTHYLHEIPPDVPVLIALCGMAVPSPQVTTDRGRMTCRLCTRRLRAATVPRRDTYAWTSASFYEQTRAPWNLDAFREALRECADVMTWREDGAPPYKRHPEPRTHRWSGPAQALRDLVRIRADGYSQGSVHDPRAIARKLGHEGVSYAEPAPGRALDMAEDLVHVDRAFAAAFPVSPSSELGLDACRLVLMLRWVGGQKTGEIAETLEARGLGTVDAKHVGRIARKGRAAVYQYLRARDLVPRSDEDEDLAEHLGLAAKDSAITAGEDDMGRPSPRATSNDLFGWQEIAEYLGVDPRTARRWADDLRMPVVRIIGRIEASSAKIAVWRKRQESSRAA